MVEGRERPGGNSDGPDFGSGSGIGAPKELGA